MEEKKVLNEEKIEAVTGGRHYAGRPKLLSPEKTEELMKSSVRLNEVSGLKLPRELLKLVSGGVRMEDDEEEEGDCPYCGGSTRLFYNGGEWVVYCSECSRIIAGSDFWLYPDDDD